MWRYAANLTAHALSGTERAASLLRWARHVREQEGGLWGCVGIWAAAGGRREARQVRGMGAGGGL